MRDFRRLQEDPPAGVSGAPGENNIMIWNAVIFGPHDTPFEDGTFKLVVSCCPLLPRLMGISKLKVSSILDRFGVETSIPCFCL